MKRFMMVVGLGLGITLGGGIIYAFYVSEAARLIAVGVGAFLLAALTIGGTALAVNRQWTGALGSHRTTHHHRYQLSQPSVPWGNLPPSTTSELLPPDTGLPELEVWSAGENDDIVA